MDEKGLGRVLSSVKRLASYSRFPKKKKENASSLVTNQNMSLVMAI